MTNRLLIIEDDPQIASALIRGLALHGFDATSETQAASALRALLKADWDGAVVDVMLGSDSGINLVRAARAQGATLPILMLSALSDVDHRTAGLEAGADDYIVKPFSLDELVARIRVQQQRTRAQCPDPAVLSLDDRQLRAGEAGVALTERECALLAFLIRSPETPQSRGAIFDALWAAEGSGHENVVDVYIGYLRKKLNSHEFGFEIKTIRSKGFLLTGTTPIIEAP